MKFKHKVRKMLQLLIATLCVTQSIAYADTISKTDKPIFDNNILESSTREQLNYTLDTISENTNIPIPVSLTARNTYTRPYIENGVIEKYSNGKLYDAGSGVFYITPQIELDLTGWYKQQQQQNVDKPRVTYLAIFPKEVSLSAEYGLYKTIHYINEHENPKGDQTNGEMKKGKYLEYVKSWIGHIHTSNGVNYGAGTKIKVNVPKDTTTNLYPDIDFFVRTAAESMNGLWNSDYTTAQPHLWSNFTNANTLKVDGNAPILTVTSPDSNWIKEDKGVTIDIKDLRSGIKTWKYRITQSNGTTWGNWILGSGTSTTVTLNSSGTYYIEVYAEDNIGNNLTKTYGPYKIDKIKPTGTISHTTVPNTWTNKDITVSVKATDEHSGVAKVEYSTNGGNSWSTGNTVTLTETGEYTVKFKITDKVGLITELSSGPYKIDKIKPTGTISHTTAPNTWTNKDITVSVAARDTHSGVAKVEYSTNGGNSWSTGNSVTLTATGEHTVKFRITDKVGLTTELSSGPYRIDKVVPTANIIIPTETDNRTIPVKINDIIDIHSGAVEAKISNNSDFSNSTIVNLTGQSSVTTNFIINKGSSIETNYTTRTIYVRVIDKVGNYKDYTLQTLLKPMAPVKPVINTPKEDEVFNPKEKVTISWTYKDNNTDFGAMPQIKAEVVLTNKETNESITHVIDGNKTSLTLETLEIGTYEVTVTTYNWEDVKSTSDIRTFRYGVYKNNGNVRTIEIAKGSPLRYIYSFRHRNP